MRYTSVEAVLSILVRDVDDVDSTAASLSTGQIEDAIESAETEVDAKLAHEYQVPFPEEDQTPPLIRDITRDIAAFLADLTFRRDADYTSDNEPMLMRHRRAQELLALLSSGNIELQGALPIGGEVPGPSTKPVVKNAGYYGNLFTLDDFRLGPDNGYPLYPTRTDW